MKDDLLIIVLGRYVPEKYDVTLIACDLIKFCLSKGWGLATKTGNWDVRDPQHNRSYQKTALDGSRNLTNRITEWHHDPANVEFQPRFQAVWANFTPTLIKLPDDKIVQPNPGDVVVFDNIECEHKMPEFIHPKRYFARGWDICRREEIAR